MEADGKISPVEKQLSCWQDDYDKQVEALKISRHNASTAKVEVEPAEVFMSLVVPAFNEEARLGAMLSEAVEYLEKSYGRTASRTHANGNRAKRKDARQRNANGHAASGAEKMRGWEVLVVSDGSTDKTIDTTLQLAKNYGGDAAGSIRVIDLQQNRGKGGAVTHGLRHVRGQYAIFADADGASKFEDLGKLVDASQKIEDVEGRGVAVGSRAHLVGSEAVVKVLLTSFHLHIC